MTDKTNMNMKTNTQCRVGEKYFVLLNSPQTGIRNHNCIEDSTSLRERNRKMDLRNYFQCLL